MADAVDLLTAEATPPQMAAFLMGLRVRGETLDEITGAARALRRRMSAVEIAPGAIDIVGTGGDGHGTFNVSTASAIVAAGAGLKVAKHGNRSVSSLSGASDVLSALGVKLDCGPVLIRRAIEEAGVGFLWAPAHHPAMKAWAAPRAELGVRTLFNLLGPICNPAGVRHHVLGVFDQAWVLPMAEALRALGSERAWVVHGHDGLDELSTTGADDGCGARGRQDHVVRGDAGRRRARAGVACRPQGRRRRAQRTSAAGFAGRCARGRTAISFSSTPLRR